MMIQQVLAFFTPATIAANPTSLEYQRTHILILATITVAALSLPSIGMHYFTGSYMLGHLATMATVSCVATLLVLRRRKALLPAAFIQLVCVFGVIFTSIIFSGGIISPILSALYSPSLLALLFIHRRAMIISVLITIGAIGVLMLFSQAGYVFPKLYSPSITNILHGFIAIVVLLSILAAFYFSDRIRQEAYVQLEKERDSVQSKVQEATKTLQAQQDSISRINIDLADQNLQLQKAILEAEQAKKIQSEFLRNVSHEVRTPLALVLGFSEILTERISHEDSTSKEFVGQIALAGQNLMNIFSNILALSELESTSVEVAPLRVFLPLLVSDVQQSLKPHAAQKGLAFSTEWSPDCEPALVLDSRHVREIARHLLSNAIKFTEHGSVLLRCELDKREDTSLLRLIVQDTGIGIAPEFQEKLFSAFQQHDGSTNRAFGGLGLGLAITKRLVDALGGEIRCVSAVGRGTTFTVELPCSVA
jgi:signal transduction histidine kinase